jgi:multidrug efflux system membrane fusion protein
MGFQSVLQRLTALLVVSVMAACSEQPEQNSAGAAPPLPSVSVAPVIYERLTEWDEFVGRLESPENVTLRPRVSGYIDQVMFQEGARVNEGQTLFVIDQRPFKAEVKRLKAELDDAKSQSQFAQSEFQRAEQLIAQNAVSKEEFDSRYTQLQSNLARINGIEAALELAELDLSYTKVTAPIDGRASRAIVTKGNFVTAGQTTLTTIMSTDKMYAYFDADEQTYLKYAQLLRQAGSNIDSANTTPVQMALINEEDFPHKGHIDFIDNQVNPETGTIRARAVFDNAKGELLPGLFSRVRLVGSATYDGILIDDRAIGTDLSNKFVLVLDDNNVVQYRSITLGEKINGLRIVKSGLNQGDKIVVNGLQRVRPGTPVNAEIVEMAPPSVIENLKVQQIEIDHFNQRQLAQREPTSTSVQVGG